ncbi:type I glyceraldehyde-3-phosphate dehydrogenase [Candidatus Gottesmanbacteria bacterium RIFCSPHIGHO2_02_FULL_39_11]|uniref:Glyceraldehyde-3-phosphate dehydrogenase n=1 Tax=Candidatus Gottesmanbacteria bacterium RIFCSPHIGHO2_02_FULL_39_11 TaxID=1798382 RepID=A0A1F5ZT70_9BACT|nr:MAG: type I glyceraldehyde-3-phosphate dehydrogenase [Candidatus Gottesmanbacteria bacterium RIFCSPHIGHO2_02_FULL_39_11]
MKKIRVGINGFGRIGRVAARIIEGRDNLELAAINSHADSSSHAYLLKYDSTYGIFNKKVKAIDNNFISIDGRNITVFNRDTPSEIPWEKANVDIVIDSTGLFTKKEDLMPHIRTSVKKVVLSSPAKDDMKTIVMGVNEENFNVKTDHTVSNSSCTTNCLATTLKVLDDSFNVKRGFMTTTHAVTDSQNLLDNSHKKETRLRRSAIASLIPASTGSAKDIGKLFPKLNGKILCRSIRVPLQTVSLINVIVELEEKTTIEEIHHVYNEYEKGGMKGILEVAQEELVSKDYTGNPHSSIIDPFLTQILDGNLVNIYAWYDNEWGYTSRLVDLVELIGKTLSS